MKVFLFSMVLGFITFSAQTINASVSLSPAFEDKIVEHGGGCRKSSPPGQCCHMNRKIGVVHCH